MRTFNVFINKYKLKIKATSNIKTQQILPSIGLDKVGICLRDGKFLSKKGMVNLHATKATKWVSYEKRKLFR